MELDDLKQTVANLEREVAYARSFRVAADREQRVDRTRASLRSVLWEHVGQVALGVGLAAAVAPFWWSHRAEPALLVAGLLLHVYSVLMVVLGSRVIVSVRMLDLDAPVLEIQRALARLRRSYVITGFVVALPWWLLWFPLVIVVFGFDLGGVSRAWLVTNLIVYLIVGIGGIAGTLWYYRHVWLEPVDSERRRSAEESAAGKSFRSAQRFLDEIARFERE